MKDRGSNEVRIQTAEVEANETKSGAAPDKNENRSVLGSPILGNGETMSNKLFRVILIVGTVAMILAACAPASPTLAPVAEVPTAVTALPFAHTACAEGVDLTGQTVPFYHILDPHDQVDTVYEPLRAGYGDAAEYFNAHGGICGATLEQVFDDSHWGSAQTIYELYSALDPKPVVVTLYGSGDAVQLADRLATDEIPALNIRGGSTASAYGRDGQTPGWVFATNPLYVDQVGAMCDYIVANADRFPDPVMGFINFDDPWARTATEDSRAYCASLGIGYAGTSYFSGHDTYIHPHVQNLIDAGANILYTHSHENGPALVAKTLVEMGLQDKVTLATVNRAMDPSVAFSGEANLGGDGLPMINGMIGSLPVRSWAEAANPGIQLITAQADLHQRPLTMRTDGYIMGWDTTDLLIEVYIQTGNLVGFDHITGADIKKTLENIVYAPLGGVEQIDYQGGTRRALVANRIGQMNYLGQDGKMPAGPGNPPMLVTVGDQQFLVPMVIPLTDYQPAPDLRPGGADVPTATELLPTSTP
jgi:ABC-type branched-subunit amino acid transport system substrate-binding protein